MNASGKVQPTMTRLEEVTKALKAAHQQGLLVVFEATVTHLCEVPASNNSNDSIQQLVTISIDKWKSLASKDPGWGKIAMTEEDGLFVPGGRMQSVYRQVSKQDSANQLTCKPQVFDHMTAAYAPHLPAELAHVVYANCPS